MADPTRPPIPPIKVLRTAREWATAHRHPQPDDRMLAIVYAAGRTAAAADIPDPADVELVRNAWRNAPCPTCHRQRACRCIVEDHDLRDYRARAVLSALADAGRLRAAGREQAAADLPGWLIEILHVAWAFARREHEGQMVTLVPEHARAALADLARFVLLALALPYSDHEGFDPAWRP